MSSDPDQRPALMSLGVQTLNGRRTAGRNGTRTQRYNPLCPSPRRSRTTFVFVCLHPLPRRYSILQPPGLIRNAAFRSLACFLCRYNDEFCGLIALFCSCRIEMRIFTGYPMQNIGHGGKRLPEKRFRCCGSRGQIIPHQVLGR